MLAEVVGVLPPPLSGVLLLTPVCLTLLTTTLNTHSHILLRLSGPPPPPPIEVVTAGKGLKGGGGMRLQVTRDQDPPQRHSDRGPVLGAPPLHT